MNTFTMSGLLSFDQFLEFGDIESFYIERIFGCRNRIFITVLELLEPMGYIGDSGHFKFHAMVSRTCPAKVCPAPPRISRREPPVLDEDVGRIDLAEFGNDAVDLFLVAVDDQPEAGLLDHN